MATIHPTRLFRVNKTTVVTPDIGPAITLEPDTILWQHASRRSSLGGYIGTFSFTYQQVNGVSPKPGPMFSLSKDNVDPVG